MRKVVLATIIILALTAICLVATSCTPEQVQQYQAKVNQQLTDPAGPVQQTAAAVGQAADNLQRDLAPAAGVIPGGGWILAILGAISGIGNIIQRLQNTGQAKTITIQGTAIKEIVAGGEQFKTVADSNTIALFKQAQAAAQQTAATRLLVSTVKAT